MKLGFIVNPIAGMGGRVGLKGTDGLEILEIARSLGAKPESPDKAKRALELLLPLKDKLEVYTYPGAMGEDEAKDMGFNPIVLESNRDITQPRDTEEAAKKMKDLGVDLILFAGGDGTARNIYNAIGDSTPVIGIPAGVKIHSGVYASHPRAAGTIAYKYLTDELERQNLSFAVRMYIPQLIGDTYIVPPKMWPTALMTEGWFKKETRAAIMNYFKKDAKSKGKISTGAHSKGKKTKKK